MFGNDMTQDDLRRLYDANIVDQNGDKVGGVGQIYLDDQSDRPTWATAKTGLFGTKETFVPLAEAQMDANEIRVPYTKDFIKDAPSVDAEHHISEQEEDELYRYYGFDSSGRPQQRDDRVGAAGTAGAAGAAGAAGVAGDRDRGADRDRAADPDHGADHGADRGAGLTKEQRAADPDHGADHGADAPAGRGRGVDPDHGVDHGADAPAGRGVDPDHGADHGADRGAGLTKEQRAADPDHGADRGADAPAGRHAGDGDSMVRREEELHVGKERVSTGRVRLRKHVTREQESVNVPVEHEEVHVTREPVREGEGVGRIGDGDESVSVQTHEERPVVDKETVAKERVGLDKEAHTENERVTGEVAKEQIEVERDGDHGVDRGETRRGDHDVDRGDERRR